MEGVLGFAGVAGVIAASMGLALFLEWIGLRGLMRLMPSSAPQREARRTTRL